MNDKTVAFVLYPGLTPLDLIGPLQVMSGLETVEETFGVQPRHHVVVVAENLDAVPTDTPVRVAATSTLNEAAEPDVIVVPGGGRTTASSTAARLIQLVIEYDPHPPHGGIDWSNVDRDMLAAWVEGLANEALADDPAMLARLLG